MENEWQQWVDFHAGIPLQGDELKEILDEGYQEIPMQWVDVDKNEKYYSDAPKNDMLK